jgi:hypothetical protein
MLPSRKTLGLAVTRQAITAVEVVSSRGRRKLARFAVLYLSQEVGLHDPAALGRALKNLLRANHFSASRCVIGLEAAYLSAREKRLPAAASGSLVDILRIAAEQDFASDGGELVLDYVSSSSADGTGALLVAAPRKAVDSILSAAVDAGLRVAAVTSSSLALAKATVAPSLGGASLMLLLAPDGAEAVFQRDGAPRLLRRLSAGRAPSGGGDGLSRRFFGAMEGELRRMLAANAVDEGGPVELDVWNAEDSDKAELEIIGERLGMPTRFRRFPSDVASLEAAPIPGGASLAPAAALAMSCSGDAGATLDFLHSRLAPPRRRGFRRYAIWGGVAAVVLIALFATLVAGWRADRQEVEAMRKRLDNMKPAVQQAKNLIDKASFARLWFDRRPKFLECLREVTLAFPEEGRIWATSLVVREDMNMKMVLSGKASGEQPVFSLLDRLNSSPKFTDVQQLPIRKVSASSQDVSFAISFSFQGAG